MKIVITVSYRGNDDEKKRNNTNNTRMITCDQIDSSVISDTIHSRRCRQKKIEKKPNGSISAQ